LYKSGSPAQQLPLKTNWQSYGAITCGNPMHNCQCSGTMTFLGGWSGAEQQARQKTFAALDKAFVKASPGSPQKGLKTWSSSDEQTGKGTWVDFWAGNVDAAAPNGGSSGSTTGGFHPKQWCAASGAGKCKGDWSEIALDSALPIKGVTIQGWGKSCVSKFTVSVSMDGKSFTPVDKGATFDGLKACSTTKDNDAKTNVVFDTAAEAKHVRISVKGGTGSCCLRWSALALTGKGVEAWKRMQASLKPSWMANFGTCADDGMQGFHKVCTLAVAISESNILDKTFAYTCPSGWYWATRAQYKTAVSRLQHDPTCRKLTNVVTLYGKCGFRGYNDPKYNKKRIEIKFKDYAKNNGYLHVGAQWTKTHYTGWQSHNFGGIACVKNGN
jgi:hypothetical protein